MILFDLLSAAFWILFYLSPVILFATVTALVGNYVIKRMKR